MTKRIVLSVFLFIMMILVIPTVQSLLFASHTTGKMIIEKELAAPYLQGSEKEMMLVFFGYVGCVKVCTPILQELDKLYDSKEFAKNKGNVDLMFVNLMPELEPDQPDRFAKSFNPSFKGVYLTQKQLMSLDRELGVYFSKSIGDSAQIDHSDNLYLVKKQKDGTLILKSIYSMHPLKSEMLISDIEKMSNEKK